MFLIRTEVARSNSRVKIGVCAASFGIELDDILQRCKTTVVHIRRRACGFSKRGRLECAAIVGILRNDPPAFVGELSIFPGHTRIVETLVSEIRSDVTT